MRATKKSERNQRLMTVRTTTATAFINDTITLGNGAGDTVFFGNGSGLGTSNDTITLGNGIGDLVVGASSANTTITLGSGAGYFVEASFTKTTSSPSAMAPVTW